MSENAKENGLAALNSVANAQQGLANCLTYASSAFAYYDPNAELRQLVADLKKAMEPPTAREKRLTARVVELESKLAKIKEAAG